MDVLIGIAGAIGGIIGWYLRNYTFIQSFNALERRTATLEGMVKGARGNSRKAELKMAEQEALMAGLAAYQSTKSIPDALKTVMATNPEGAEQLLKKYGKFIN